MVDYRAIDREANDTGQIRTMGFRQGKVRAQVSGSEHGGNALERAMKTTFVSTLLGSIEHSECALYNYNDEFNRFGRESSGWETVDAA